MAGASKRTRAAQAAPSTMTTSLSPRMLVPTTWPATSLGSADWTHRARRSVAAARSTIPESPPLPASKFLRRTGLSPDIGLFMESKPLSRGRNLGILCPTEKGKTTERWRRKASDLRVTNLR